MRQYSPYQENWTSPPEAPLHPWEWPHEHWVRSHLDYTGLFLGKMFLIVIDAHKVDIGVSNEHVDFKPPLTN